MILLDNIYYILYNYFQRTNSGKYGYKATASAISGFYFYFGICILYFVAMIIYYVIFIKDNVNVSLHQQNPFLINNDNIFILLGIITNICIDIRYYVFKNMKEIREKQNDMNANKKERLNILAVSYMVTSPFLLFFLANYVRDLYR